MDGNIQNFMPTPPQKRSYLEVGDIEACEVLRDEFGIFKHLSVSFRRVSKPQKHQKLSHMHVAECCFLHDRFLSLTYLDRRTGSGPVFSIPTFPRPSPSSLVQLRMAAAIAGDRPFLPVKHRSDPVGPTRNHEQPCRRIKCNRNLKMNKSMFGIVACTCKYWNRTPTRYIAHHS